MRRRLSDLDPYLAPPWREQFSRAGEEREDEETRRLERGDWWLEEIAPDGDDSAMDEKLQRGGDDV